MHSGKYHLTEDRYSTIGTIDHSHHASTINNLHIQSPEAILNSVRSPERMHIHAATAIELAVVAVAR